jgi:hypothetical protein
MAVVYVKAAHADSRFRCFADGALSILGGEHAGVGSMFHFVFEFGIVIGMTFQVIFSPTLGSGAVRALAFRRSSDFSNDVRRANQAVRADAPFVSFVFGIVSEWLCRFASRAGFKSCAHVGSVEILRPSFGGVVMRLAALGRGAILSRLLGHTSLTVNRNASFAVLTGPKCLQKLVFTARGAKFGSVEGLRLVPSHDDILLIKM